ncbi:myelin-associated oligodendrocyte basic protein-like [Penaeus vannamei]|uniref:myelin-associated oligodendrocyte basic protein-like n=1 Tax=Penaeus vannamei TaxID=6689 RepID=UPI00387FA0B5
MQKQLRIQRQPTFENPRRALATTNSHAVSRHAPQQDMQRPYRHSPILFRDPATEPRSPPASRPGSVVLRERDPNSPTPGSRPTSALLRDRDPWSPTPASLPRSDRDPRSPTPAKPSPLVQGERDFRSPTPSRPFPFRQKDRV